MRIKSFESPVAKANSVSSYPRSKDRKPLLELIRECESVIAVTILAIEASTVTDASAKSLVNTAKNTVYARGGDEPWTAKVYVDLVAKQISRIYSIVRGFVAILRHHRASDAVCICFSRQAAEYLYAAKEDDFLPKMKYLCAFPLAQYLGNDLPECTTPFKPTGMFSRWMRVRLHVMNSKNTHLWSSWNQAKRAAEPMTEAIVLQAYTKHWERMQKADPAADDEVLKSEVKVLMAPILQKIGRKIEKRSELADFSRQSSTKASFEQPRSREGMQGALAVSLGLATFVDEKMAVLHSVSRMYDTSFGSFELFEQSVVQEHVKDIVWSTDRGVYSLLDFEPPRSFGVADGVACEPRPRYCQQTAFEEWPRLWSMARDRTVPGSAPLECMIQAVKEPAKIRIISKGEAIPYHVSGDYQKLLHGIMRKMPCFQLIGRPACPTDLERIAIREPGYEWFSGDYEASTDNLSRTLSSMVNETLLGYLDGLISRSNLLGEDFARVFRACLDAHVCNYPPVVVRVDDPAFPAILEHFDAFAEKHRSPGCNESCEECSACGGSEKRSRVVYKYKIDEAAGEDVCYAYFHLRSITQINAQLMGSRVSFVILCLVNLALYLLARAHAWRDAVDAQQPTRWGEFESRRCRSNRWPCAKLIMAWIDFVLINGDDILFCATQTEVAHMKQLGRLVGLPLSVGKTFTHRVYANINSTSYHLDLGDSKATCKQIDYLNVGLLFGQSKVLGSDEEGDEAYLPHILGRCLSGALPGRQCDVMYDFLGQHARELAAQTRGRNLFIHPSLGGFGVPCPIGWKFDVTHAQIAEAERCKKALGKTETAALPAFSRIVQREEPAVLYSPWRDMTVAPTAQRLPRVQVQHKNLTREQLAELQLGVVQVAPRDLSKYDLYEGVDRCFSREEPRPATADELMAFGQRWLDLYEARKRKK